LSGALLLLSGAGWLVSRYALRAPGPFGDVPHPSEVWWLRVHGAAVIGFLLTFGALLTIHVPHNWRRHLHRGSGLFLVLCVSLLALSGYGLYYLVSDSSRAWISLLHWAIGLLAAAGLAVHIVVAKRRESARRLVMPQRH
jgi:hypothetical protein